MPVKFVSIFVLVNQGYSEIVMEAARNEGARGGTIVTARGTANKQVEDRYGIVITPEKELIIILVDTAIKDQVMTAINKVAGIETKGVGIIFTFPVENVVGIKY